MDHSNDSSSDSAGRPDIVLEVNILNILDYVGESVRPIREGFAVFAAKHIVCLGYRMHTQEGLVTEVTAYVNQSSNPAIAPHELHLKITPEVSDWRLKCSCKAGTGKCKHIMACLLHIDKNPTLEYMSCTDVKQAWGISKQLKTIPWRAKRVKDLCCVAKPLMLRFRDDITDPAIENEILDSFFQRILAVSKNSAVAKHKAGRHLNTPQNYPNRALQSAGENGSMYITEAELRSHMAASTTPIDVIDCIPSSEELVKFYQETITVDFETTVRIALSTRTQSTNEWKLQRSRRITASSAYNLYTYLSNKNPNWEKKISQYWGSNCLNVKATRYGKETEPLAFTCYQKKRNSHVKKCGLTIHPTQNWIAGSPDGIDIKSSVLLEIKCPGNELLSLAEILESPAVTKYIKANSEGGMQLKENHMYYCQVQLNMWILNCASCDFVIYSKKDDDFQVIEVKFDKSYTENIVNNLKKLYFDRMLTFLYSSRV